jgi:hypothetical protein
MIIKIRFRCAYSECAGEKPTEVDITIPKKSVKAEIKKEKLVYCKKGHPNIIHIPENWNPHPLVLDDDIDEPARVSQIVQGRHQ